MENEIIQICGTADIELYPEFDVSQWEMRLQQFIVEQGNLTTGGGKLSNGANINPFTMQSFGCFKDYSDIIYSDYDDVSPFINWWMYGQGIGNKPAILCTISMCNLTVYNGQYSITNGSIELDLNSLTMANRTATLAVSGAAAYIGQNSTDNYRYISLFTDDQIQLDLSTAVNIYGNDSVQFGAAWGQALSNRLLGWSAGAIYMERANATMSTSLLGLSIPVATAHAFAILHFMYALIILSLGVFCCLRFLSSSSNRGYTDIGSVGIGEAQARLGNPYSLAVELTALHSSLSLGHSVDKENDPLLHHVSSIAGANEGDIRVGLRRDENDLVRLDFRSPS